MSQDLKNLIAAFILPPGGCVMFIVIGLLLTRWQRTLGWVVVAVALGGNLALTLPFVSDRLIVSLENDPPLKLNGPGNQNAQAIAIMGCGYHKDAPEFDDSIPSACTLERMNYGAYLHAETGLPVLATGGGSRDLKVREGIVMKSFLESMWRLPVRWIETDSMNSNESAVNSFAILKPEGIKHILLVTHAWHMTRAKRAFEQVGFQVTAAPTRFARIPKWGIRTFIPRMDSYVSAHTALREYLGQIFYRMAYE